MSAFENNRNMYIQLWLDPAMETVTFDSVAEVEQCLPIMRQELKALENLAKLGTFVDPQQIIIFKHLFDLINEVPKRVSDAGHSAEFKALVIAHAKAFVLRLAELCRDNPEELASQIATRLQEEQAITAQVLQNTQQLQAQLAASSEHLYDPALSSAEREEMRKYGIHPTTPAPEASLCITISKLLADVKANLETKDPTEVNTLNESFKQIHQVPLSLSNLVFPELLPLEKIQIILENFLIIFSGRNISISEYNKLPDDIKIFLNIEPLKAMPYYEGTAEPEFIVIAYCLLIIDKLDKLEEISHDIPDFATMEAQLQSLIRKLFVARLRSVLDLKSKNFTKLRIILLNLLNVFKSKVINIAQFQKFSNPIKILLCENPDVILQLLNEQHLTILELKKLETLLPKIIENINDIREYCASYGTTLREFFSRDPAAIKKILTALAPRKKMVTFKVAPIKETSLFRAIKNNDYSAVFKLIGNETLRRHFDIKTNILEHNQEGISYYTCALQEKNIEIIALVLKAVVTATDAKLRRFLRINGFTHATNLNALNAQGETPLTCALKHSNNDQAVVILGLLARNVDIFRPNTSGETPSNITNTIKDTRIKCDLQAAINLHQNSQLLAKLRTLIN